MAYAAQYQDFSNQVTSSLLSQSCPASMISIELTSTSRYLPTLRAASIVIKQLGQVYPCFSPPQESPITLEIVLEFLCSRPLQDTLYGFRSTTSHPLHPGSRKCADGNVAPAAANYPRCHSKLIMDHVSQCGPNHTTKNIIKELCTNPRKSAVISTNTTHHEAKAEIS
jgi:hypothetical protein